MAFNRKLFNALHPATGNDMTYQTDTFRYDLAAPNEPRIILITNLEGSRREVPRLGYVVLPQRA